MPPHPASGVSFCRVSTVPSRRQKVGKGNIISMSIQVYSGGTQPVLTGAVQVSASTSPRTAASVAARAAASTQGTQPVVTGAVRESAASMVEGQMPALVGTAAGLHCGMFETEWY